MKDPQAMSLNQDKILITFGGNQDGLEQILHTPTEFGALMSKLYQLVFAVRELLIAANKNHVAYWNVWSWRGTRHDGAGIDSAIIQVDLMQSHLNVSEVHRIISVYGYASARMVGTDSGIPTGEWSREDITIEANRMVSTLLKHLLHKERTLGIR